MKTHPGGDSRLFPASLFGDSDLFYLSVTYNFLLSPRIDAQTLGPQCARANSV